FKSCIFLSSRRRHTMFSRDWSSDVCSSDLIVVKRIGDAAIAIVRKHVLPRIVGTVPQIDGCLPDDRYAPQIASKFIATGDDFHKIGRASCRERVKITVSLGQQKK